MKMFLVRAELTNKWGTVFTKNMMLLASSPSAAEFHFRDLHAEHYEIKIKDCTDVGSTYLISWEKE